MSAVAAAENGQIASLCYVEHSDHKFDGFGIRRTTSGQRFTPSTLDGGYMSMLARRLGISPDSTPKVHPLIPLIYLLTPNIITGWGKKMAYCIAFSHDNAVDVTRRYVRPRNSRLPRTKCPEEVLIYILNEIRDKRRAHLSPEQRKVLQDADKREMKELRQFEIQSLMMEGYFEKGGEGGDLKGRESGEYTMMQDGLDLLLTGL